MPHLPHHIPPGWTISPAPGGRAVEVLTTTHRVWIHFSGYSPSVFVSSRETNLPASIHLSDLLSIVSLGAGSLGINLSEFTE